MINGLKFGFWVGFVAFLVLSVSAAARAAPVPSRSSSTAPQTTAEEAPRRLYLSAAVNQGASEHTELLLLATVELGSSLGLGFVIEGGAGWMHDKLTGTAQAPAGATGLFPTSYEVVTEAGVAELSPRLRVVGGLELGPLVELLYGADVSFAPGVGTGKSTAWLGGGQALYGFKQGGASIRAGARYLQSLNLANYTLQSIQATLQIGLPVL